MTANFPNVTGAIKFLNHNGSATAPALIAVLEQHAEKESPVSVVGSNGEIATMTFTSTHSVDVELEVDDAVITIHEVNRSATATITLNPNVNQETTMNTNNQTNASSTTPPVYSQEEREALLAKMAAMQKALDEMSKGQPKAAEAQPKAASKATPSEEDNKLAMTIGKGVLYTAGAVAVGVGGWFAWKKWGSSSTQA